MSEKISVFEQIKNQFNFAGHKISAYIPCQEAIDNICADAQNGSVLAFVKLYRLVSFGETTTKEELNVYLQATDVFDKLSKRWIQDCRKLEKIEEKEIFSEKYLD